MADLLSSLTIPSNYSSQESFHSISSQPPCDGPMPDAHDSAEQAAGLNIREVDSYLTSPENASYLNNNATKGKKTLPSKPAQLSSDSGKPISLGLKTSHYVGALNQLCQSNGFLPVYEIDGNASLTDFGGVLRLGDVTIASDERWHSKKDAKEGLAEKGMETARGMKPVHQLNEREEKNWVGMLLEYHNLVDPNNGPRYELYTLGSDVPPYGCTCTTPHIPDHTFGSEKPTFPNKKGARFSAAKEAVECLITRGDLNADGTTKSKKKLKLGAAVRLEGKGLEVKKESTYAQRVQDLCPLLGLTSPQYTLMPAPQAPNMLSGYASFPNQSGMPKQIGEVRNVFGKKNAKEGIAEGVWDVLKELAEKRGVKMDAVKD